MKNNLTQTLSSVEIIDSILRALGISREDISTYCDYLLPNGTYLRLRISDHGVNLSTWFKENKKQREIDSSLPKLNGSTNVALTFAPNKDECLKKRITFPQKAINKTSVKTETGRNVKPQFSVGHIQYASWLIDNEDVEKISSAVLAFAQSGVYVDPLGPSSGKILAWQDTSNLPPKRLTLQTGPIKFGDGE